MCACVSGLVGVCACVIVQVCVRGRGSGVHSQTPSDLMDTHACTHFLMHASDSSVL